MIRTKIAPEPGEHVACPAPGCLYWATVTEADDTYVTSVCPDQHEHKVHIWSGRVLKHDNPGLDVGTT